MASVGAREDVSGERRKPKPSGSTSRVPSPNIDSPFLARFLSRANISSCLRNLLALSISLVTAISSSWLTWRVLSSDNCIWTFAGWPRPSDDPGERKLEGKGASKRLPGSAGLSAAAAGNHCAALHSETKIKGFRCCCQEKR